MKFGEDKPKGPKPRDSELRPTRTCGMCYKNNGQKATSPLERDAAHWRWTEHPRVGTVSDAKSLASSRTKITKPLSFKIEFKVTGVGLHVPDCE